MSDTGYRYEDAPSFPYEMVSENTVIPTKEWIWTHFIAKGEVCFLCGQPFIGKSNFVAGLACAVQIGAPFLGKPVKECSVLYIAYERFLETKRRIKAQLRSTDHQVAVSPGLPLTHERWLDSVRDTMKLVAHETGTYVQLVIIDTLAMCAPGIEENSAKDTSPILSKLTELAQSGLAVVVLHHPSKGGSEIRGSSAIDGAVDRHLSLKKKGKGLCLTVARANSGSSGQSVHFQIVESMVETDPTTGRTEPVSIVADYDCETSVGDQAQASVRLPRNTKKVFDWLIGHAEHGVINRKMATRQMLDSHVLDASEGSARKAIDRSYGKLQELGVAEISGEDIFLIEGILGSSSPVNHNDQTGTPP